MKEIFFLIIVKTNVYVSRKECLILYGSILLGITFSNISLHLFYLTIHKYHK